MPTTTTTFGPTTTSLATTTTTLPGPPPGEVAVYDLVESNGALSTFGGAGFFGSKAAKPLPAPVVAAAASVDGGGYWLVTANGNLYNFGDAPFYGSAVHRKTRPIVGIAATANGQGYWLATANGGILNFGNAPFCGSAVHLPMSGQVAGIATTADGGGYWLVTTTGRVLAFGDAGSYGSASPPRRDAVVGLAPTADGLGYFVLAQHGNVYNFGDAKFSGSAAHLRHAGTFTGIAATPDGGGYWLVTTSGRIFNFGDAKFWGSLAHSPPRPPARVIAVMRTIPAAPTNVRLPHGLFGYDVSGFQCRKSGSASAQGQLPPHAGIAVIEAAGWLDSAYNSCISAEAAWAKGAGGKTDPPYNLYLFLNSPDTSAAAVALDHSGPAGNCASLAAGAARLACTAYNYGYNGARSALAYATSRHVSSSLWWLDVENDSLSSSPYASFSSGSYWSYSYALNDQTIQGALDALRQGHLLVGIYSTSVQYRRIAGNFAPSGPAVPLWIAGVPWTSPPFSQRGLPSPSVLARWCAGTASYTTTPRTSELFAGGVPMILQETPGNEPSPYGLDPDYTC